MEIIRKHIPVVLLFFWAALLFFWQPPWTPQALNDTDNSVHCFLLLSAPYEYHGSWVYEAVPLDSIDSWARPKNLLLYIYQDSIKQQPLQGDIIASIDTIKNNRVWLRSDSYAVIAHTTAGQLFASYRWGDALKMISLQWRNRLEEQLHSFHFAPEEEALVESLVLADRRSLTMDQKEAFSDAGAMHVLAVSGLHVGIIADILVFLLSAGGLLFIPWEKKGLRYAQRAGVLAGIWLYAFLTGFTTSVVRSAIMISLLPLGKKHMQNSFCYNRLAAAAFLILFFRPDALTSPSFLLSFSAVLSILYFNRRWNTYLPHLRYGSRTIGLIQTSLAAQLGTLPWTLYFFQLSANYFLLTNLIVIPLANILLACSFAGLACSFVPFLSPITEALMWVVERTALLMNSGVKWVQSLPGSTSFFSWNFSMSLMLIGSIIFFAAGMCINEKRRYLYLLLAIIFAIAMCVLYALTLSSTV